MSKRNSRSSRKQAKARRRACHRSQGAIGLFIGGAMLMPLASWAAELPVPCGVGSCGSAGPITFVTSGAATTSTSGNTLTVSQSTNTATLNWASFNIDASGRVVFVQPSSSSIALNRIYQQSPSQIFGQLTANGQVYLVNPNGMIFGSTARVSAAGILASTLTMSDATFQGGLLSALAGGQAALASDGRLSVVDANGQPVLGTDGQPMKVQLVVQQGAQLSTNVAGGRVLLAGQEVDNGGSVSAADGQVIIAAGQKVYLQASADPALRGLLVEVDAGGKAWNQATGQLDAARGNVTMVGLAVNQDGRASASTTVSANGSVRLLARDTVTIAADNSGGAGTVNSLTATRGGTLTLGGNSLTTVTPELADTATAVDDQAQSPSRIELTGQSIHLAGGSRVVAPGGSVSAIASSSPAVPNAGNDPLAQIQVDAGALVDVSGSNALLPVSANVVEVQLRANELRDSPDQRNGALRGATVTVDARAGTAVADVSGAVAAIPKNIAQRTSAGGTATFNSNGGITVASGAKVDVSGGQTTFEGGVVNTSQLITADGRLVDIGSASETTSYVGVLNPVATITHDRWGIVQTIGGQTAGHFESGYVSGASAGTVSFLAPSLALQGTLQGNAVNGPYQRSPASSLYASGGQLVIGSTTGINGDYRAPAMTLLARATGSGAGLQLGMDALAANGFTRFGFFSNGTITVGDAAGLRLADGSSLTLRGNRIEFAGSVQDLGGSIDAAALVTSASAGNGSRSGVAVGNGVTLDVSGTWTNDLELSDPQRPVLPLLQNGGTLSLAGSPDGAEFVLGDGATLLANGGAWVNRAGTVQGGRGGVISLAAAGRNGAFKIGSGTGLVAFGTNGALGGKLTLTAGRITIGHGSDWAAAGAYDPLATGGAGTVQIADELFSGHGLSNVRLVASGGTDSTQGAALLIGADTRINAIAQTRFLASDATAHGSGASINGFSSLGNLPAYLANPATLSFAVAPYAGYVGPRVGDLDLAQGASLAAAPGSSFSFTSAAGSILLQGSVLAHGGSIMARIDPPANPDSFAYDPALKLGVTAPAQLDVSGTTVLQPNDTGLLQGTVSDGGSISLVANAGALEVASGAGLDVSGAVGALDLRTASATTPFEHKRIGSNAGSLTLGAAESISFAAQPRAFGGVGDTGAGAGGTLSVVLSRGKANLSLDPSVRATFPDAPRVIEIGTGFTSAPDNGQFMLDLAKVRSQGFDDLRVRADDLVTLDAGVQLAMARRISIDAPVVAIGGTGTASLAAPYVQFTNSTGAPSASPATGGGSSLDVSAGFIDLAGPVTLRNVGNARFTSGGDIELRGLASGPALTGSLSLAGDLTLTAARIYGATLAQYAVNDPGYTIDITANGTAQGVPLSAASFISFNADNINQAGTLLAPFGHIELNAAQSLTLAAASRTSVSAAGATIPFGSTVNGTSWVYNGGTTVTPTYASAPARQVGLTGNSVSIAAGAVVDVAGGGDLHAFEWVKGSGGSLDALLNGVGNQYAILPAQGNGVAAYDAQDYLGSSLQPGSTVYLSGGAGLAAGYYTLLPARYALLPGALLLSQVQGTADMLPGSHTSLADGTPVVAGYFSFGTTGLGGTRYAGFSVRPGTDAQKLAQYDITLGSTYFANSALRTVDAGALSLSAASQLIALGSVSTAAATGGTGATIEVSASDLNIVAAGTQPGAGVTLQDSVLNGWHASRLLLGGRRSADGTTINVAANQVTVASGALLSADEIALVAQSAIEVDAGAGLRSSSAGGQAPAKAPSATPVTLVGGLAPALLSVSDLQQLQPVRATGLTGGGTVQLAAGSSVLTRGALTLDAPGGGNLLGTLGGVGSLWSLGGSAIVFGGSATGSALGLAQPVLAQLAGASALRLASTGNIDFASALQVGGATAPLASLVLRAASLSNSGGQSVGLAATAVELQGIGTSASTPVAGASGTALTVSGESLVYSGQALAVGGFANTTLSAAQQITGRDAAALVVGGNLSISAARLGAGSGSNASLQASGDLRITAPSAGAVVAPAEIGGGMTLSATNISDQGVILAPSGYVKLTATQSLSLGSSAVIDASGTLAHAGSAVADTAGGAVLLQAGSSLMTAAGSSINVSGHGATDAGSITATAGGVATLDGTLSGAAPATAGGGQFMLDGGSLAGFDTLVAALQAGGFTGAQQMHVAQGDLTVAAGTTMTAHDITLATDQGAITVSGSLVAPSNGLRSSIRLYGSTGVTLQSGGLLRADAASAGGRGGSIELGVGPQGSVALLAGGSASAQGATLGSLWLRAPKVGSNDVAVSVLDADLAKAGAITIEAVVPTVAGATVSQTTIDGLATAAMTYMTAAQPVIQARLNGDGLLPLSVTPGIELQRTGALTITALALNAARFGGLPGALTVRATGTVQVNGTITDGFVSDGTTGVGNTDYLPEASSTLRIVAGSNLAASDPLAVDAATGADLRIAARVLVRTGTGNISLAAARDVVLATGASVYTGGLPGAPTQRSVTGDATGFAQAGGQLSVRALRDVVGAKQTQAVTAWMTRVGSTTTPVAWGTDVSQFGWNLGTLGGGDLAVTAGRDILQLSAATADSALQDSVGSPLQQFGGGNLSLRATNNISGGSFYVAQGTGRLRADGGITTNSNWIFAGQGQGVMISQGNASFDLGARTGIAVAGVVDPTVLRRPTSTTRPPFFFTYGPGSTLAAHSAAGTVAFNENATVAGVYFGTTVSGGSGGGINAMPPNLVLSALSGDIVLGVSGYLFPSERGQLVLFAARDISSASGATLSMSDAAVGAVPTPFAPLASAVSSSLGRSALSARHLGDLQPAQVSAGRDISRVTFSLAKPLILTAGRDIIDAPVVAQNLQSSDITQVSAARDIIYTGNGGGISVGGPGRLDVLAGRHVDLGVSGGAVTTGNLRNANLAANGADLTVMAGIGAGADYAGFVAGLVAKDGQVAAALVAYMAGLGQPGLTATQALAAYTSADPALQRPFALQQFFTELVASGRQANLDPNAGFGRGYAAIDALFPGSRGDASPYVGNINLDFSRIYTLGGGTLRLLAPGGRVNVGVAVPPANAAARNPSELGIVAQKSGSADIFSQGDVLVNESRVFTLLGGDIAIWSTLGNIDAGRGAKSSLSAPPPVVLVDAQGNVTLDFTGAIAGSGIRTIATSADAPPGNVDLIAPAGFVNAGDAGIGSSGNINIAAHQVIGVENIQFGGAASGVPAQTSGLAASLSGASAAGNSSTSASTEGAADQVTPKQPQSPLAQAALSWLEVFVLGLGEDACRPDDLDCLKRQKKEMN